MSRSKLRNKLNLPSRTSSFVPSRCVLIDTRSLSSMNLPGAIEAIEAPTGVPQAIEEKRRSVNAEVILVIGLI